jgi:uncharacterized protein (TIGR02996 family)
MNDEARFLRGILEKPEDAALRLVYADWLEARGDPRAEFLRIDPDLERIAYVPWLERDGHLDYYLQHFPEVQREAVERQATEHLRQQRRTLSAMLDPEWVAFINTLGCSFRPFLFFNNHGNAHECRPDELPFAERIGTRGSVVTFESDFQDGKTFDQGLMRDLRFLCHLELGECAYGAARCPVHPFVSELKAKRRPLTASDVLAALRPRAFRSRHIQNLAATQIHYPGYHPGDGSGTDNDEIHNDFTGQYIFQKEDEDHEDEVGEFDGTHGELKRFVADGRLWYVLLHTTPEQIEEFRFSRYVVLFAVGGSPNDGRLLGVVTHQVCHNLCD